MPRTEEQRLAANARRRERYAANKEKESLRSLTWRQANPEKVKVHHKRNWLKRKFGLALEEYDRMVLAQDNLCAICKQKDYRALSVDHNHETNQIRELLCSNCNVMIGHAQEDIQVLYAAIRYLRKHSDTNQVGVLYAEAC